MKKKIIEKDQIIDDLKNIIQTEQKLEVSSIIIEDQNMIIEYLEKLKEAQKELEEFKSILPFNFQIGEKLMCVIFKSDNLKILYPIICKNTDNFSRLEQMIYDEYPEYFESKYEFIVDGHKIDRHKSLENNNIKNNSVITLRIYDS